MSADAPGFAADVRPLFRDEDVDAMEFAFDLASYDDVRANAELIHERLEEGTMPCDDAWAEGDVALFRRWIDAGAPP